MISSTLVALHDAGKPIVTTVWAGLAIFTLILTGFRSIHLLFASIDADDSVKKYKAGRDLFLAVILGSSFYIVLSIISILHYGEALSSFDIPQACLLLPVPFMAVWLVPVWFFPLRSTQWLGRRVDCMKRKMGL